MKVSLVLATLGRDWELADFLKSLMIQTYKDFELIIIDQNKDGKIDDIVESINSYLDVKHVKVDFTGNARARDYGIGLAQGRIVAFPDDDCAYDKDVLKKVVAEFNRRPNLSILVAGSYDISSSRFSIGVNSHNAQYFSRFKMMGVEFTQFFDRKKIDGKQFYLDHDFGIGSKYSGAEGFELLYRLLRAGGTAFYTPEIKIYHPDKDHYKLGTGRMLMYSTGIGAYIRKFANQQDVFILYYIARKMFVAPILKMLLAVVLLNPRKLAYSFYNLVGIWRGFLAYGR
ncbi:glycosyltransferase involved in cell wall biosynthesis [Methylobacter tundripaludum]|uniref:Glycosyltransferase involved in cell wall biosynthesis n=1 Tax=Methylobacter tundripaludum TaxID=173365 RepID=A0A2S6HB48_9GAMM|nr:glycosyltransferase family 2 protein [Methylobacter tundripaludum]PPK74636.1 glycosyltransferase involved in cell wall biosynthesis [Methylobacter tundripaludum]